MDLYAHATLVAYRYYEDAEDLAELADDLQDVDDLAAYDFALGEN